MMINFLLMAFNLIILTWMFARSLIQADEIEEAQEYSRIHKQYTDVRLAQIENKLLSLQEPAKPTKKKVK